MTAPVIEPAPVEAPDDDRPHAVCVHRGLTWCGIKATGPVVPVPDSITDICPVCVVAIEMWNGQTCPVCGCRSCME